MAVRVLGLDHVQLAIPVGGEAAARGFYGGVLGLSEVAKPQALAARGGCWFEGPGTVVHLGVEQPFAPARKAHPAFRVADLDGCRAALLAAGAPVVADESEIATRRFYTADPFGNRIEIIQDGDGFAQRSPIASAWVAPTQPVGRWRTDLRLPEANQGPARV